MADWPEPNSRLVSSRLAQNIIIIHNWDMNVMRTAKGYLIGNRA